jgi:hypothetical protein
VTYNKISKDSITDFTTNFIGVMLFICASLPPIKMNSIPSTLIDTYPNYLWAYSFHLIIHVCVQSFANLATYAKNPPMRKMLARELNERLNNLH